MTELETKLLAQVKGLLSDVEGLMGESGGIYGLHHNGDVSPWSELDEGGRFERLSHMSSARAVVAEAEAAPQPSADGWIPWAASPPMPVKPGTLVDVEFRDGERAYSVPAGLPIDDPNSRLALDWTHYDLDEDIVAYRVVKETQQ